MIALEVRPLRTGRASVFLQFEDWQHFIMVGGGGFSSFNRTQFFTEGNEDSAFAVTFPSITGAYCGQESFTK